MLNETIPLNAKVRHVEGGRTCTVIGQMIGDGQWLHLVKFTVGRRSVRMWLGRRALVEVDE